MLGIYKNTITLLRIPFSYFLMPVFFFALSQVTEINWLKAVLCFFVLHLFIYPASNGYNSYMDADETSIGGLEKPPLPTKQLFYVSILFDIIGLTLSLIISTTFFICILAYMLASRAYSYKGIRLKKYPIIGFLTVVFFQGAFTFFMVYVAVSNNVVVFNNSLLLVILACIFLIGGVYPLTQVYQHKADEASGDITISYKLGIRSTFIFCALMFGVSVTLLYFYFDIKHQLQHFILFQVFLFPVLVFFVRWFVMVLKNDAQASFKNTMQMNFIASTCMNLFFIVLIILNTIQ
jgi:1,4-dihydroxy-2-naphthoate octaprenyltransferase